MAASYRAAVRAAALLVLLAPAMVSGPARAATPGQAPPEEPLVSGGQTIGIHYRQTGGATGLGYDVREPFYSRFNSLGGPTIVGYPVSAPFQGTDGCLYQDFQVALLQQCAGGGVVLANTFQIMQEAGVDARLQQLGIGPGEADTASSFDQAVQMRLGWLEDSAIRDRYLSQCGGGDINAAWQFCGLPQNHPTNAGPFVSQRFQRIAFQRWLVDGPGGIKAGDVSASLGGDLLKDTNVLAGPVVQPHPIGQPPALSILAFGQAATAPTGSSGAASLLSRATLGIVTPAVESAAASAPVAFQPGRDGQNLTVGDVVRTNTAGDALVTYFQGTTTEVTSNSSIVVQQLQAAPSGGPVVTVLQTAGQAIHRVGQLLLPGSSFQVVAGSATVVVRGTVIRTTVTPVNSVRLEVFSGVAEFTSANVTVTVNPGQFSEAPANGPPSPPQLNTTPPPPTAPPATGQAQAAPSAAATPTAGPTSTPPGPGPRTQALSVGYQADFFSTQGRPQAISLIKNAGFGWAKQQVVWKQYEIDQNTCNANRNNCQTETINGRTHYFAKDQVGFLDAVVNDVSGSGLNLLVSVVRAPDFLAAPGGAAPANPDMLRDFVQFLATRYKGKVKAIEPWNEQNLSWEWGSARLWPNAPAPPPQGVIDFLNLQKAAYQGIKAADSSITVVLPAPTPTGVGGCWRSPDARTQGFCLDAVKLAIDDQLYLDFLFQVNNGEIKNYYDVLGVHPSGYNNPPDDWVDKTTVSTTSFKGDGSFYLKRYQQLHDVQVKYGDNKPMWFTEMGWDSTTQTIAGYEYGQDNTEAARGKYFARMLEQVQNEAPYVTNVIIWNLNFRALVGPADEKYGFGVVDSSGNPLPAYTCMQDFVKSGSRITRPECRL